jgi:putative DNA methylase
MFMRSTALETSFPSALVSVSAEKEAWRKEVHRPATHTHKWWAQRLGSVFRGILAAATTSTHDAAEVAYEQGQDLSDLIVLDPFAGSGTTLVEAAKLGARVVGYDINPVATLVQRQALAQWDSQALEAVFKEVEGRVRAEIDGLHVSRDGEPVLYYFWVSTAPCPRCPDGTAEVELFSRYVFGQHAYPRRYPTARATCPTCHSVVDVNLATDDGFQCKYCGWVGEFDGPVSGAFMTCTNGHRSKIIDALAGRLPRHRMYAKLVLTEQGQRRYDPIDDFDLALYLTAEKLLADHHTNLVLPDGCLALGYNTRQAMTWGFHEWRHFFNARQLYSLGLLGSAIRALPPSPEREALVTLFSGTLEFNNMFCSYKGEGTGAVRHMFSHHILKPERTPLEAHPWGTSASSGAFSTLFRNRVLRALEYKAEPHDLIRERRVYGVSRPLGMPLVSNWKDFSKTPDSAFIATGSSTKMDLPAKSVDLIVTDPPYFDKVHYSELADFFHSWLRQIEPYDDYPIHLRTTRMPAEVQSTDARAFGKAIEAVWRECARVLKDDGLLAFTFHQTSSSGWVAIVKGLRQAGFVVTAVQPVKGEMSVATPKKGAADPSNLDAIVACRKSSDGPRPSMTRVLMELRECTEAGVLVGWSDVQSVVRGAILAAYTDPACKRSLNDLLVDAAEAADRACAEMGLQSKRLRGQSQTFLAE